VRQLIGFMIGWLVRLWVATWRVRMVVDPALDLTCPSPLVFAFWHGQQMPLLSVRRRSTAALVSLSRDGELQSGVMRGLQIEVIRGSASRAGAAGLKAMIRVLRAGRDAAFAADGSRGPLHRAKPGAASAAMLAGLSLVPVAGAARRRIVLARAWDRFELPLPFTRVVVYVGAPVDARSALQAPHLLERAIDAARSRAQELLDASVGSVKARLDEGPSLS
jgi:lysophospholipid acyltransferase (LPLAT)-like uncharacterized protein